MKDDCLRPITYAELESLLLLYSAHRPYADPAYLFVLHQKRFFHLLSDPTRCYEVPERIRFSIYTPCTGDLKTNGTLVAFSVGRNFLFFAFTLEISHTELRQSLADTQHISWENGVSVLALPDDLRPVVEEKLSQIDTRFAERLHYYPCNIYVLPFHQAMLYEITVPADGLTMMSLDADRNAAFINSVWPHRDAESENFVRGMIKYYGGIGLYSNGNSQPLSWVVMNEFHGMGLLQTAETERRKGYAKLVVQSFCRTVAARHQSDIVAFVIDTNESSNRLMLSLGFRVTGHCYYFDYMID